jgi:hypothetical protein
MSCRSFSRCTAFCAFLLMRSLALGQGSTPRPAMNSVGAQKTSLKEEIIRLTKEVNDAEVHSDSPEEEAKRIAVMDKLTTKDFTRTHAHGYVQNKADELNALKTRSRIGAVALSDLHVRIYGPCAIINGKNRTNDLVHKEDSEYVFTAVWVQQQGKWLMATWVSTSPIPQANPMPNDAK